jgi:hypothetical protein
LNGKSYLSADFDIDTGTPFFPFYLDIRARPTVALFDDDPFAIPSFSADRYIHIGGSLGALFITEGTHTVLVAHTLGASGQRRQRWGGRDG